MNEMKEPDAVYTTITRIYEQRTVLKALGFKIAADDIYRIYCDGDNKVRIESWKKR